MKILFVAFELAPLATAGVYRPLGFIKHLPEFDITPLVVTTDADSYRDVGDTPLDFSLDALLPKETSIERVACRRRNKPRHRFGRWHRIFFSLVEEQASLWRINVLPVLNRLVEAHNPRAIYVTAPPFCMAPFAVELKRRLNLPLILDLRDAWSQWRVAPYGSWLHYHLTLRLEEECLAKATRVVTTSDQIRKDLLRLHRKIAPEKITVIMNGYDVDVPDWTMRPLPVGKTPFVIGYVGAFYYSPGARDAMMRPWWRKRPNRMIQFTPRIEDWLYRSPYFFFRAVAELFRQFPEMRDRIRIRFAGRKPEWIDAQVAEFRLKPFVEFLGYLDHTRVLDFQRECDALLITSSKVINGADYSIAGKTFEYFTMKKPILGFVTRGVQKDLLERSGMAVICDPDDTQQSASKLRELITGRINLAPNVDLLTQLSRRELTRKLAGVIQSSVATGRGRTLASAK